MESSLTQADADAICRHMNDDHADAVADYARTYGKLDGVIAARMLALDSVGMELAVDTDREHVVAHIAFDHVLTDKTDARMTLVAMARHAGAESPAHVEGANPPLPA